jgi:hypothetical protein
MAKKGNLGLRIRLVIPEFAIPYLEVMDNQSVSQAIVGALRTAGGPAVTALKQLLKADLIKSEQSTGATERAVSMKYGKSRTNNRVYYLIVGINKTHFEYHTSTIPDGQITKIRRGRKQRGAGLFAIQTRMNKRRELRSKQVFSRYRSKGRINASKGKPFKRWPKKYFHLIDNGFNHYRAGMVAGYLFIRRLKQILKDTIQQIFEERIRTLIIPTIKRELLRKYKRVLR